jgi:hypothetical protein
MPPKEEVCGREQLGNFPQAVTHATIVQAGLASEGIVMDWGGRATFGLGANGRAHRDLSRMALPLGRVDEVHGHGFVLVRNESLNRANAHSRSPLTSGLSSSESLYPFPEILAPDDASGLTRLVCDYEGRDRRWKPGDRL